MVCAPIVTSGSSANAFSSSQDMQRSRPIAVSSTPWRAHSAAISRCRSCSPGRLRSQSCSRSKAACLAAGVEVSRRVGDAADRGFDRGGLGDHPLQRDPPQPAGAFGEIAGDIDGEGRVKFAHHRQREIAVVAIAVVEGEAGEAPREIAFGQPLMHLVHGDDIDVERAQMRQHRAQEFRLDLEMVIGLELGVAARADMVQHENGADACEDRPQQDNARRRSKALPVRRG